MAKLNQLLLLESMLQACDNLNNNDARIVEYQGKSVVEVVDARLLTTDYQRPTGAEWWKMACMADTIGEELSLPNKWVVFCTLWGNNNLRKYNTDKQGLTDYNNFRKILKSQIL